MAFDNFNGLHGHHNPISILYPRSLVLEGGGGFHVKGVGMHIGKFELNI